MNNNSSYKGFYQTGLSLSSNIFGQDPVYSRNDLSVQPNYYSSIDQSYDASISGTFQTSQQSYIQEYSTGNDNQSYNNQHIYYNQSSMDNDQAAYRNYGLQDTTSMPAYFGQDMVTGSNPPCEPIASETTTIGDNFSSEQWEQFQHHFQKAFEQQLTHQIHLQLQQQGLYDSRKSGNLSGLTDGMSFGDDSVGKRMTGDGDRWGCDETVRFGESHTNSSTSRYDGRFGHSSKSSKFYCSTCDISYANSLAFTSHLGSMDHKLKREKETLRPKVHVQSPLLPRPSDVTNHHSFPKLEDHQRMTTIPNDARKRPYERNETSSSMPRPEEFGVYMDKSKTGISENTEAFIGQEFIEEFRNSHGNIVRVACNLCRFEITNPAEKWRHLRSPQHKNLVEKRMAVEVPLFGQDFKGFSDPSRRGPALGQRYFQFFNEPVHHNRESQGQPSECTETDDDACVRQMHALIYPTHEDFRAIQRVSGSCDRWLRSTMNNLVDSSNQKLISAVFKAGNLAKGLLLNYDLSCDHLVLLCDWPTKTMVRSIYEQLEILKEKNTKDDRPEYVLRISEDGESIILESLCQPVIKCRIHFSSNSVRDESEATSDDVSNDRLNKNACLRHLNNQDQLKWFQTKAIPLPSCNLVMRIWKDLRHNINEYQCLTDEVLEFLIVKSVNSLDPPSGPGAVLKKTFELICHFNKISEESKLGKQADNNDVASGCDDDKEETESKEEKDTASHEMLKLFSHLTDQESKSVAKFTEHLLGEISQGRMKEALQFNKKKFYPEFIGLNDRAVNGETTVERSEDNARFVTLVEPSHKKHKGCKDCEVKEEDTSATPN